jgi:hypothetical protein
VDTDDSGNMRPSNKKITGRKYSYDGSDVYNTKQDWNKTFNSTFRANNEKGRVSMYRSKQNRYQHVNKTFDSKKNDIERASEKCGQLLKRIHNAGSEVTRFKAEFNIGKCKALNEYHTNVNCLKEKSLSQEVMEIIKKDMAYEIKNREVPIEDV